MLDPWKNPAVWHAINVHLPIVLAILGLPLVCILAITRGKRLVVVVGSGKALGLAVQRQDTARRYTGLRRRLQQDVSE